MTHIEIQEFYADTEILTDNINRMMASETKEEVREYFLRAMERMKIIGNRKMKSLEGNIGGLKNERFYKF